MKFNANTIQDTVRFDNGQQMPTLGFGTFKLDTLQAINPAIHAAISAGYRAFDTAQLYGNEALLGQALKDSGIARAQLFITTKVSIENQGYDQTLRSIQKSMHDLQTDYIDLLLVHWPIHTEFFNTWRAFEKLYQDGIAHSIGVCNYQIRHLDMLAAKANEKPAINQIEIHPGFVQDELLTYLQDNEIAAQAWSPLGRGSLLDNPTLTEIAARYCKSVAQVILRWHIQRACAVIPKSATPERIQENAQIYNFHLSYEDMQSICTLNAHKRTGPDPDFVYHNLRF